MIQGFKNACQAGLRARAQLQTRCCSSSIKTEWKKRRNLIFDNEVQRQRKEIGRIEKITVKYVPTDKEKDAIEYSMNKCLSTPNDIALHISESVHKTGALAKVDGVPWDMHRPFVKDCEINIFTMQMPKECPNINSAFWRTCSFVMGAMIEESFKDDIQLYLHSFPRPNLKSGSFVYNAIIDLPDWKPTNAELRALSAAFVKITNDELPIERLVVTEEIALDMFQDNPYKTKQIPEIAKNSVDNDVTLYRIRDHIDLSRGPMVGHTGIIGRTTIAAVHKVESEESDHMYRFQGIALPRGTYLNHFAFGILEDRAKKLNEAIWMPQHLTEEVNLQSGAFAAQN